jgi:hypothetical protein
MLTALGAAVCGKKLTTVDPTLVAGVFPEGVRDSLEHTPSDLVVWPDLPIEVRDVSNNSLVYTFYRTTPGAMQGVIFDYCGSTGYQMFRRETGGGFRQYEDFIHTPSRRWADRDLYGTPAGPLVLPPAQLYPLSDATPPPVNPDEYIGRAVVAGVVSGKYPITNLAQATPASAIDSMGYRGLRSPPDSLIDMTWDAVPGASGYWIHIFQKNASITSIGDVAQIGLPSPVSIGKVRDLFIGYIPAPNTSYKLGNPVPTRGRILVYRVLETLQPVFIRVSAVDANGRLIATTDGESSDFDSFHEKIGPLDRLVRFKIGAVEVTPLRPLPPQ